MPDQKKTNGKSNKVWKNIKKIINNLIVITLVLVICLMAFILIQTRLQKATTPSFGPYRLYIVLSGSMEPALHVGGIIIVKEVPVSEIKEGDIVTFNGEKNNDIPTTHRVIGIEQEDSLLFQTKGDANEVADPAPVEESKLIGKVVLHVPYAGYILDFAKKNPQLPAFIALPAVLLILWEVLKFGQKFRRERLNTNTDAKINSKNNN